MSDELTKEEALTVLQCDDLIGQRMDDVMENGMEAYTTSCGWMGYSDEEIREKLQVLRPHFFKEKNLE